MQLARWFAEPRRDQNRRNLHPRDALLANRQQALAQILKPHSAPQRERQIHVTELTRALDADALQAHRYCLMLAAIVEQRRLLGSADQSTRKYPCFNPPTLIKLTKLRYRLLNDAPTNTNAAHQPPIAVNLPVLSANRVAQIHASSKPHPKPKKIPKVGTTRPNQPCVLPKALIRLTPLLVETQKATPNCASWAKAKYSHGLAKARWIVFSSVITSI